MVPPFVEAPAHPREPFRTARSVPPGNRSEKERRRDAPGTGDVAGVLTAPRGGVLSGLRTK
ncbi:hypothetical protein GCM10010236_43750 [Streptomyces eurythermus]|nr:hypothetical protein GCM10010236_43750 [Streptomyces eurythermus]